MNTLKNYLNQQIFEGISTTSLDKYIETVSSYMRNKNLWVTKSLCCINANKNYYYSILVFSIENNNGALLCWDISKDFMQLSGVGFTDNAQKTWNNGFFGGNLKIPNFIELKDMSVVNILPFIANAILDNEVSNTKRLELNLRALVKEYGMFENLNEAKWDTEETTALKIERTKLMKKRGYLEWKKRQDTPEYQEVVNRIAEIEKELENAFNIIKNVNVKFQDNSKEIEKFEEQFELKATPQERFSDMEQYISMVIKGLQPSLLICGAPGVGKTYRVKKKVQSSGLKSFTIKGKVTPLAMYQYLFDYSQEDSILIIDDADEVLENDVITNLLKAATDSSDERIVSYGTSKPPMMSEEQYMSLPAELQAQVSVEEFKSATVYFYPKYFVTEGKIIIITNKNAGMIDTAVRNRGLICDLAFTTEECLNIIKELMPGIMADKIGMNAKLKAYEFLTELAEQKSKMEISIRSFTTVAKVYEDVTDDNQAMRMIKEQMRLQADRTKRKY